MIDIGVNLTNRAFANDLPEVLARSREAGVKSMVITGTSVAASESAFALAKDHGLHSTAGVHPHDAKTCDDRTLGSLRDLAEHEQVVAIGECGLDFDRNFSPRPVQERWFEAQLELAAVLRLPVFLHERAAHERCVAIIRSHRDDLVGGVAHCFTGGPAEVAAYLDLDLHIGVTGWICDERRGQDLYEAVKTIPRDRLMLETDAPYLMPRTIRPRPKRGRNEPAFLRFVRDTVAEARGEDPDDVGRTAEAVTRRFFGLPT